MEKYKCNLDEIKPYIGVIVQQFITAGMIIISKLALNHGVNQHVLVVYRYTIATLSIAPFAFFFERNVRPKITLCIFFKVLLLGVIEPVMDQNLYYTGMKYTTATFAIAMSNMGPALIFVMAVIVRLEKVKIRKWQSQAKIVGTVVTVGGAIIMNFTRGPEVNLPWTKESPSHQASSTTASQREHLKGTLMIVTGCICRSAFNILQAITIKSYPAELSLTTLICFSGAVQGAVIALAMEWHNPAAWSIHLDSTLLAPIYSGIMSSGVAYSIQAMVMRKKGPVFASAFSPLSLVFVAIISSFALAEILYVGRIVGASVIITGLYFVLWGKSKDQPAISLPSEKLELDQKMTAVTERTET